MDRAYKYLWLIPLAFAFNRLCSLMPAYLYFDPFPMHNILDAEGKEVGISLQSYVYMISIHVAFILFWIREILSRQFHYKLFKFFLFIEILSLLDFLIRYEQPFFDAGFYRFEFTDIKIAMYCLSLARWKRNY